MIKDLTFITGNEHKAQQTAKHLGISITRLKLDLDEIQSLSAEEIIEHKARQAYEILKVPVLVDDSALVFEALNGLPGPFVKFFLHAVSTQVMCDLAASLPNQNAVASVILGFYDGKKFRSFKGEVGGEIAKVASDDEGLGFGFDMIFIPDGYNMTRAEMNEEEYDETNPRRMALEKLQEFLEDEY